MHLEAYSKTDGGGKEFASVAVEMIPSSAVILLRLLDKIIIPASNNKRLS